MRSTFQHQIYHVSKPLTPPKLCHLHPARSPPYLYELEDPAIQQMMVNKAAQMEANCQRDATMERARHMSMAELADRHSKGLAM